MGGQWRRWLDSHRLSPVMCLYFSSNYILCTYWYSAESYHLYNFTSLVSQFSPFANQFPFFFSILRHFLVYGSYEGEIWLEGRAPLFPLSLVPHQIPSRSKLIVSLFSHLEIILCDHFQLILKSTLVLIGSKTHTNSFTFAVFCLWAIS